MKTNNVTREIKVGVVVVIAIFVLYFGMNFLKGIDIFTPVNKYYGTYENVGGLVASAPVYVKGYKVGQVDEVKYDFSQAESFKVSISVDKDIQLPEGTKMQLYDDGLMGGKAIQLVFPLSATGQYVENKSQLPTEEAAGLFDLLQAEMLPKLENTVEHVDSLVLSLNALVNSEEVQGTLVSLKKTSDDLAVSSNKLKMLMHNEVPGLIENVDVVVRDLGNVSADLAQANLTHTLLTVDSVATNLQLLTQKINEPNGTIGLLLNDKDLYFNLSNTAANADKLLIDLRQHPKRYVHFSLFGRKEKQDKTEKQ